MSNANTTKSKKTVRKTVCYAIFRHGSNAANQSMTPVKMVGYVDAANADEAYEIARTKVTCYNNQSLEVKPAARVRYVDWNEYAPDLRTGSAR